MSRQDTVDTDEITELVAQFGTDDWEDAYERVETLLGDADPDQKERLLSTVVVDSRTRIRTSGSGVSR